MIYLLTGIELPPSGSSTVHIYTQTIHRTRSTTTTHRTTQLIWEEFGPCPIFSSYTLASALQLRKKHGKTLVRVGKECQLAQWKHNIQNRAYRTMRQHTWQYQEQSLTSQKTPILIHTTVRTSNSTNIFFSTYMTQSTTGLRCGYTSFRIGLLWHAV